MFCSDHHFDPCVYLTSDSNASKLPVWMDKFHGVLWLRNWLHVLSEIGKGMRRKAMPVRNWKLLVTETTICKARKRQIFKNLLFTTREIAYVTEIQGWSLNQAAKMRIIPHSFSYYSNVCLAKFVLRVNNDDNFICDWLLVYLTTLIQLQIYKGSHEMEKWEFGSMLLWLISM